MKAKTISEPAQPVTSELPECLSSVRIARPVTPDLVARSRRRVHGARALYRSTLQGGLCASRVATVQDEDLPCVATYSCFPRMPYPVGWSDLTQSTKSEARN